MRLTRETGTPPEAEAAGARPWSRARIEEPLGDEPGEDEAPRPSTTRPRHPKAPQQRRPPRLAVGPATPARRGPPAASGSTDDTPKIDDPMSKWWVGIMVAVFLAIVAYGALFGVGWPAVPRTDAGAHG